MLVTDVAFRYGTYILIICKYKVFSIVYRTVVGVCSYLATDDVRQIIFIYEFGYKVPDACPGVYFVSGCDLYVVLCVGQAVYCVIISSRCSYVSSVSSLDVVWRVCGGYEHVGKIRWGIVMFIFIIKLDPLQTVVL
jgi:hypothetical protein